MADTPHSPPPAPDDAPNDPPSAARVLPLVALAYALLGTLALWLAIPPGYASPLFPSAGVALAAALVYGVRALPAVALGSLCVHAAGHAFGNQAVASGGGGVAVLVALAIACGAAAQAGVGAWLVRRASPGPLTLDAPRAVAALFVLGGLLACLVSASVGSLALWAGGMLAPATVANGWWTWWVGDALGAVIAAPVVLAWIGTPRAAWRPRSGTVALPLLVVLVLLAAGIGQVADWAAQRRDARFERDAVALARTVELRLASHLDALHALYSVYVGSQDVDAREFRRAAAPWLAKLPSVQAIGWHERVPRDALADFEARVGAESGTAYRVFEREPQLSAGDAEVVAMRYIEPHAGNDSALGINALSVAASRTAVNAARGNERSVATEGFRLTQESGRQTGVVIFRAVHEGGDLGAPLQGLLFVTLRTDDALRHLVAGAPAYLRACLIDRSSGAERRLAGEPGCEDAAPAPLVHRVVLPFASREWELRLSADAHAFGEGLLGGEGGTTWMFSISALAATALLGALLLIVTGRHRRTENAVAERTLQLQHEVAERRGTELALRESEQRFRGIFNAVPIGVVYTDLRGRIKQPNAAFCALLHYSEQELQGLSVMAITHEDDRAGDRSAWRELIAGQVPVYRRRKRHLRRDGEPVWVQTTVSLLRDEHGRPHRLLGLIEDLSETLKRQEAETARATAETANRAKSEFLSRMSHELRTPLNAMLGFAQLLEQDERDALAASHRRWVAQIQQAGWHLLDMINDVLDLSRIESGSLRLQPEPIALEPLVAASMALVEPLARQRGITVRRALAAHAPLRVLADATRVKQILTNLLSNAVKYNREGGEVRVETRRIENEAGVALLELDVADTGPGMSDAQLAQLFQPFNRLGRERFGIEGTGIGLVIAKLLAERHGGGLRVRSSPGEGAVFTLALPLTEEAQPTTAHGDAAGGADSGYQRRQVLYIEDNDINVEVMRGMLAQRPQVQFRVAGTGLDGLAIVRTAPPDLVLLDMHLPDIAGMTLLQHLQSDARTALIPVVVVSADALPAQIAAALAAGARRYLTKPVALDEVLAVVDELLSETVTRFG